MRMYGKREKTQRVELKKKRSGICVREHATFLEACRAFPINVAEEIEDIKENNEKSVKIRMRNNEERGRRYLLKVAEIEVVGESYEEKDIDEGEAKLKATLVDQMDIKTYVVDQEEDTTEGKQIMRLFTRTVLKKK